jgi:hypothetical protein
LPSSAGMSGGSARTTVPPSLKAGSPCTAASGATLSPCGNQAAAQGNAPGAGGPSSQTWPSPSAATPPSISAIGARSVAAGCGGLPLDQVSRSTSPATNSSGTATGTAATRPASTAGRPGAMGRSWMAAATPRSSDQLPSERAASSAGRSPALERRASPGTGNRLARAQSSGALSILRASRGRATRTTQHRLPPFRKKDRTAGPRYARCCAPRARSQARSASAPNRSANAAGSSTATGVWSGPAAANPTKAAMSIRGSASAGGGGRRSNWTPGRRRVAGRAGTAS